MNQQTQTPVKLAILEAARQYYRGADDGTGKTRQAVFGRRGMDGSTFYAEVIPMGSEVRIDFATLPQHVRDIVIVRGLMATIPTLISQGKQAAVKAVGADAWKALDPDSQDARESEAIAKRLEEFETGAYKGRLNESGADDGDDEAARLDLWSLQAQALRELTGDEGISYVPKAGNFAVAAKGAEIQTVARFLNTARGGKNSTLPVLTTTDAGGSVTVLSAKENNQMSSIWAAVVQKYDKALGGAVSAKVAALLQAATGAASGLEE